MRIGALLLVGVGFICAAACTANTSSDLACYSAGGVCVAAASGCSAGADQLPQPCDKGTVCCTPTPDAASVGDGATGPTKKTDSGSSADAGGKGPGMEAGPATESGIKPVDSGNPVMAEGGTVGTGG